MPSTSLRQFGFLVHPLFLVTSAFTLLYFMGFSDQESSGLSKRDGFVGSTAFKVLIAVGVFVIINVLAVTFHHIAQKIARSSNLYKSVEHDISPF